MKRVDWRFLLGGAVLAVVIFAVSKLLRPEWGLGLPAIVSLAALALTSAYAFLANVRQAVSKSEPPSQPITVEPGGTMSSIGAVTMTNGDFIVRDKFQLVVEKLFVVYESTAAHPLLDHNTFALVLEEFLRWTYEAHSQARLYGLESLRTARGEARRKLDDVFVPLTLIRFTPLNREELEQVEDAGASLLDRTRVYQQLIQNKLEEGKPVELSDLLTTGERLAVVGGAGSGKSTLLAYLAAALARWSGSGAVPSFKIPQRADGSTDWVPLFVPLRYYQEYKKSCEADPASRARSPQMGTLLGYIAWYFAWRNSSLGNTADFFSRLLRGGRCLLMVDGLDEIVSQKERGWIRQQVENLLDENPGNRAIVTARESGYRDNAFFGDNFTRLDVKKLEVEAIHALVHNWCEQIFPGEVQEREDELMQAIESINKRYIDRGLTPLISTPLMTTMVVSVKWGETELPRERARLYEAAVKVILQAQYLREDSARSELVDWGGPWEDQRDWLSALALEMQQGGEAGAVISEEQVRVVLRNIGLEENTIDRFIQAVRLRGGLFEERGEAFQFIHLTLQEFLAARLLAKQRQQALPNLEPRLSDPWWREVLLLLYGFALNDYAEFAKQYLQWLSGERENDTARLSGLELAGSALLEIDRPRPDLIEAQAEALSSFLFRAEPPIRASAIQRCEAGNSLARLGDPRFDPDLFSLPRDDTGLAGFVEIPAGPFVMGEGEEEHQPVLLTFWLARYPVTVAQFAAFAASSGYAVEEFWAEAKQDGYWSADGFKGRYDNAPWRGPREYNDARFALANHPVVGVSWYEALAYCRWLEQTLRRHPATPAPLRGLLDASLGVCLPSEAEWEKAARGGGRGGERRPFLWEGKFEPNKANTWETGVFATSTVGCFPEGAARRVLQDMSGNVCEWTRSVYLDYPYDPQDPRREDLSIEQTRVLRGGSWYLSETYARGADRLRDNPFIRDHYFGFRLALSRCR